jgi:hypothetical protein
MTKPLGNTVRLFNGFGLGEEAAFEAQSIH